MSLIVPEGYSNALGSLENTEKAIKAVKDMILIPVTTPYTFDCSDNPLRNNDLMIVFNQSALNQVFQSHFLPLFRLFSLRHTNYH